MIDEEREVGIFAIYHKNLAIYYDGTLVIHQGKDVMHLFSIGLIDIYDNLHLAISISIYGKRIV